MPRPRLRHWHSTFSHSFHRRLQDQDFALDLDPDQIPDQDLDIDQGSDQDLDQDSDQPIGFACFRTCFFHSSTVNHD
jgi:hypothetical protein